MGVKEDRQIDLNGPRMRAKDCRILRDLVKCIVIFTTVCAQNVQLQVAVIFCGISLLHARLNLLNTSLKSVRAS